MQQQMLQIRITDVAIFFFVRNYCITTCLSQVVIIQVKVVLIACDRQVGYYKNNVVSCGSNFNLY